MNTTTTNATFDGGLLPADRSATLLIDGEWRSAANTFDVLDPATMQVIGVAADAKANDAELAMDAAWGSYTSWRAKAANVRASLMRNALERVRDNADALAVLLSVENGKPLPEAQSEILRGADMFEWGIEEGKRVYGRVTPNSANGPGLIVPAPVGPALTITPWNFPASMLMRKIGLSLAAGSPVISKPAEQTPLIAVAIVKLMNEELPAGVVNLLTTNSPGEVVDQLMADKRLRKVTFTGSTEIGLMLSRKPGPRLRRIALEMGGHSPAIVFEDADLDAAAERIVMAKFPNAGQTCLSINRLFIHENVAPTLIEMLVERVQALKLGYGLDEGTRIGPLIEKAGIEKVTLHVDDAISKGAKALVGARPWDANDDRLTGAFYEPTVLVDVNESMSIAHEETFGPVLPIYTFNDDEDIIERANATSYGLASYVFGKDMTTLWDAIERLEFGVIGVNDPMPNRPELPFGGLKNSGQGREGGTEGILDYVESRAIALRF